MWNYFCCRSVSRYICFIFAIFAVYCASLVFYSHRSIVIQCKTPAPETTKILSYERSRKKWRIWWKLLQPYHQNNILCSFSSHISQIESFCFSSHIFLLSKHELNTRKAHFSTTIQPLKNVDDFARALSATKWSYPSWNSVAHFLSKIELRLSKIERISESKKWELGCNH